MSSVDYVNQTTLAQIEEVSRQIHRETTTQNQARTQNKKAELFGDILASPAHAGANCPAPTCPATRSSAQLPAPNALVNSYEQELASEQGESIIAILGIVLTLQAKTNSLFWSTMWQQASKSMDIAVKMAPIIANSVIASYENQALISEKEGSVATQEGLATIISGASAMLLGAKGAYDELNSEDEAADDIGAKKTAANSSEDASEAANKTETTVEDVSKDLESDQKSATNSSKLQRGWSAFKGGATRAGKAIFKTLEKSVTFAQMSMNMSQGITKLTVEAPAKAQIANYQRAQGQADAASKVTEQYAQYYNQDFGRNEDLRRGAEQNLDYALNILKSASDLVAQTVTSMFRG